MGFWQRLIGEEPSLFQQWLHYYDKGSFGRVRVVFNTVPSLYELFKGQQDWTQGWINNVDYWSNSRNLTNEMDKAFKDPVKGHIINQFLR